MADIMAATARLLTTHFGAPITLREGESYTTRKSVVTRYHLVDITDEVPSTVVVKHVLPDREAFTGLLENWASARFLSEYAPTVTHLFYGGDRDVGVLVLEDLGISDGTSTQELAFQVGAADKAMAAMIEHAGLIGRLHDTTAGKADEYECIRADLGLPPVNAPLFRDPWSTARRFASPVSEIDSAIDAYRTVFADLGLKPHTGFNEEIAAVVARVEDDPTPFLAFCQGDQNGPGASLPTSTGQKLYDFDCGAFRHALLEGVPGRSTWGCFMRLPDELLEPMETAYRTELQKGYPEAVDDAVFWRAFIEASARWHTFQVLHRLPACLPEDGWRGPTTRRQQLLAWLDRFVVETERLGMLEALGESSRRLAYHLRTLWSGVEPLPYYPAFA